MYEQNNAFKRIHNDPKSIKTAKTQQKRPVNQFTGRSFNKKPFESKNNKQLHEDCGESHEQ